MSPNLDQEKTGQPAEPIGVAIQSAEILSICSDGRKPPYALTENQGLTVTQLRQHNLWQKQADVEAPCYQINFRGLAAYRNITNNDKHVIRMMINHSKNDMFYNHPWPYGVPLLRRMMPVWIQDSDSTLWFGGIDRVKPQHRVGFEDLAAGPLNAGHTKRKDLTAASTAAPHKEEAEVRFELSLSVSRRTIMFLISIC
jgi:hypothetical protein